MAFRKKISHNHSEAGSLNCTGKSFSEALIECQTKTKKIMYTTCSEIVVFMYWTGKSMNNH